jgi:hypothetical protein
LILSKVCDFTCIAKKSIVANGFGLGEVAIFTIPIDIGIDAMSASGGSLTSASWLPMEL